MTIPLPADGHGTTITFAGFSANLIDVQGPDMKVKSIDTTNMGSTSTSSTMPAELIDPGTVTLTVEFDPSYIPPIGTIGSLAILWGSTVPKTWTYAGAYLASFKTGAKIGARMEATVGFTLNSLPVLS